ncbi:ABC-type phosphate/phosphonate transport system, substrate-binding protein [Mesorhizobium albiziae]|uniref:ABC-type phosphate/phosphonate transport system, substrate-binding protein n=1 Tax=Neomesorhizobium albiziae TaxID=335020 RepID=A0A1I3V9A7_9HYPH|nr:PhnD/SsuA/transferrin family substrate-binding protein [Mesorhizobium albiziae]GLS28676.1 phosphate ABC transporter substrate-binding protein [Mesorhizobium albiziae]SFJ90711.1 ABC-type phosphate/phosphonate transport system, substrate-binding protein [Mesorhizobium albiziae]
MTEFIAALPMYEWPETGAETDAEWARLRGALRDHGIDAPARIVRRNADLPAVPGGIRDANGRVIAADPATLAPDELDFHALWLHPQLLFTQTCWGPMELGLARHVQVIGQPSYGAFEGGQGEFYSSALVMRRRNSPPAGDVAAPANGKAAIPLDLLRGKRLAYNSLDSMSGIIALTRDLGATGESLDIFSGKIESGGHRQSIMSVAEGKADVAAIDCRSFALAQRFEPAAARVDVVGWTARRKGLPYITARTTPDALVAKLRAAVASISEAEALVG